jgi:quercetin dioxygenase-like cupin family protein
MPVDDEPSPTLKTHDGYEWLYVLNGKVRLILGNRDLTLKPGEVVEFDTRTPHWVGNPGPTPAEVLAIFGPQGERMHVRS